MLTRRLMIGMGVLAAASAALLSVAGPERSGDGGETKQAKQETTKEDREVETKKATFGAGCFWGVELRFSNVEGVIEAVSGYMGGSKDDPTYKEVCTDKTGHAEVVQVEYDPEVVSYEELLDVFWHVHDPTQVNRQGPDRGSQYRTVIFYHDDAQRQAAEKSKAALQESEAFKERFGDKKIATAIEEASTFWRAEDYHQDYLRKRGQESCHVGW